MLHVLTQYGGRRKIVTVYQEWDIANESVVDIETCTKADAGKLVRFTDGSGWFVRMLNCSDLAVKTESGTYRREDIVQCSRIKWPGGNYSGVPSGEEHPLVRGYTRREKAFATRLINGTLGDKKLNKRMRMLALEKLQEASRQHGVDEEFIVGNLVKMATKTEGRHSFNANITLARMNGIELNQQTKQDVGKTVGIFAQFNGNVTIQGERRREIPVKQDILDMIPAGRIEEGVVIDELNDNR